MLVFINPKLFAMILVITEKPSQALDIANGIGNNQKKTGYFEVNDYFITWAFGHLFTIDDTEFRDKKWNLDELPLLPNDFEYIPAENKENQINIIHNLIGKASKIIVATDAGREGELIAREILVTYKGKLPSLYRFWTSEALTPEVVKKCIADVKPLENYDSLFYSAKARQISDWVVGINLTRLFSIKGNSLWSVGRVQTPSLSIIVNRDNEVSKFTPTPFSNIIVTLDKDSVQFNGKVNDTEKETQQDRFSAEEAAKHFAILKPITTAVVKSVTKEEKSKTPPPLYSLTLLQRAGNRKYGYTAKETLEITQALYETHKCTSYPRTESRHLAESSRDMVQGLLEKFNPELANKAQTVGKRVFDDTKLSDHHAIIPLAEYKGHNEREQKIYDLIKNAFIAAFMDDFIFESTKVVLEAEPFHLPIFANGNRVISLGWKSIYTNDEKEEENENELPELNENNRLNIIDIQTPKSMTKPPAFITEDSLLGAMEKLNLGTPATRDSIIEKLISTNYIGREKKNLLSTSKGKELIEKLNGSDVANAELTSNWENQLDEIYKKNKGTKGLNEFIDEIHNFTRSEIDKFKNIEVSNQNLASPKMLALAKKLAKENNTKDFDKNDTSFEAIKLFIQTELEKTKETTPCPCGTGKISSSPKAWNCDGCKITIWKEIAGKKLTLEQAIKLYKGESVKIKGLKSKAGKRFDASLKLVNGKVVFEF